MSKELEDKNYKQSANKPYTHETMENMKKDIAKLQQIYDRTNLQKDKAKLRSAQNSLENMREHNKKAAELIKKETETHNKKSNERYSMLEPIIEEVNNLVNKTEGYKKEINKEIQIPGRGTSSVKELSTKTAELTALDQTIEKQNSKAKDLTASIETKEKRIKSIKKKFILLRLFSNSEKNNLKNEVVIDKNSLANVKSSLSELTISRGELATTISTISPPIQKHCKDVQERLQKEKPGMEAKISTLSEELDNVTLKIPSSDVKNGEIIVTLEGKLGKCQQILTQSQQTLTQTLNINVGKDRQSFADLKTRAQGQTPDKGSANIHAKSPNKSNDQKQPATGR